jgi:hypothetical protein
MYWRRFAVSSIPLDNAQEFEQWIRKRWLEKDDLLELYMRTGRFPPNKQGKSLGVENGAPAVGGVASGYIETEVRQRRWWECGQIFVHMIAFGFLVISLSKGWHRFVLR